jgi:hypothetical protein
MTRPSELENRLDSFDPNERREALRDVIAQAGDLGPQGRNVNMHCHSFFSYNAFGWSPTRIAWEARKRGFHGVGLCDFDVLDGLEEFLQAAEALGLRATVNLETRAFLKEYAQIDVNSPGEPGVAYVMGAGFANELPPDSPEAATLDGFRQGARERNVALIDRINARLPEIAVDYERDVLPRTPLGGATERHIVAAYVDQARERHGGGEGLAAFWAELLGLEAAEIEGLLADRPTLEEKARSRLAKRGGLGYIQPSIDTFPPVDDFLAWVAACRAVPMATWLDGTCAGESDGREMLERMAAKGAAAVNLIPDRNWRISEPKDRAIKRANLREIVEIANDMRLPVNIGTELNKGGQPVVDDLGGKVLSEFEETFLRGAQVLVGHTILLRYADFSYIDEKADAEFGGDVGKKNDFFAAVGALPPLSSEMAGKLRNAGPDKAYARLRDSARKRKWKAR